MTVDDAAVPWRQVKKHSSDMQTDDRAGLKTPSLWVCNPLLRCWLQHRATLFSYVSQERQDYLPITLLAPPAVMLSEAYRASKEVTASLGPATAKKDSLVVNFTMHTKKTNLLFFFIVTDIMGKHNSTQYNPISSTVTPAILKKKNLKISENVPPLFE